MSEINDGGLVMTVRDVFAKEAMSWVGNMAKAPYDEPLDTMFSKIATLSYKMADAMIDARGTAPAVEHQKPDEPKADAEGWIKWNGGERPVASSILVEVRTRDGLETYTDNAFRFDWAHDDCGHDIIAYRFAQEGGAA